MGLAIREESRMKCPDCGSGNVQPVSKTTSSRGGLSLSKGIIGGLLLGPLGAVGGALMGNKKSSSETYYHCMECGNEWKRGWFD